MRKKYNIDCQINRCRLYFKVQYRRIMKKQIREVVKKTKLKIVEARRR